MVNLVRRVKKGHKLTKEERAMLQSLAAGPVQANGTAKNYVALADALGVTRRALQNWRKLPGAPSPEANGQHSVVAWRHFCTLHDLKGGDDPRAVDETALRARKLLAETEEKEIAVAIRKREWVRMDEVAEKWSTGVSLAVSLLRKKFENELPPVLSGMDAPAIQEECRKAIDEVLTILHEGAVDESPFALTDDDEVDVILGSPLDEAAPGEGAETGEDE